MSKWKFETDPSAFFVGHVVDEKNQSVANVAQGFKDYGAFLAAAPAMGRALLAAEIAVRELCEGQDPANQCWETLREIREAIEVSGTRSVYNMLEDQRIEALIAQSAADPFIFRKEGDHKRPPHLLLPLDASGSMGND